MDGEPTNLAAWLGTATAGLVTGVLWLRTKLSKDAAAIANSRAEVDMLARLQEENKELRMSLHEVTQERNKLYREVGELVGSVRALESSQKLLEREIQSLRTELGTLRGTLERSGDERHPQHT